MNPINDSLNKTIYSWFGISGTFLILQFLLFLFSCQKDEENLLNQKSMNGINMTPFSASSCKTSVLYYGHQIFRRVHGKPFVETQKIENPDFELFNNNFVLKVLNGDNKKTRVSSAEIRIDGKLIIGPRAFSKNVSFIWKKLHGLTPESILEVKLTGTPGSFIDLCIEGTLKEVTVTDIDGNIYKTVKIGNQWWMAENLKTTKYRNGDAVPNVTDNAAWEGLKTGAYCWYNNDITNKNIYGALYNWYAVNDSRNLAPSGWHVATVAEWDNLVLTLDPDAQLDNIVQSAIAGAKLKEAGSAHWISPNLATNETGFTALPGGERNVALIGFAYIHYIGLWFTSTEYSNGTVGTRDLNYEDGSIHKDNQNWTKWPGLSVRCIKDF